jgi:hypothetical protein
MLASLTIRRYRYFSLMTVNTPDAVGLARLLADVAASAEGAAEETLHDATPKTR